MRSRWRRIQARILREFPLFAENFKSFLPVHVEHNVIQLKGKFSTDNERAQMGRNRGALEGVCADELNCRALKLQITEGELTASECFIKQKKQHLRSETRLEELKRSNPDVAELVKRMEGRVLD